MYLKARKTACLVTLTHTPKGTLLEDMKYKMNNH